MDLYLHIGTPKTGSTSIQSALTANTERLGAQGYLLPDDPKSALFATLPLMAAEARRFPNIQRLNGLQKPRDARRFSNRLTAAITAQITAAGPQFDKVILSSEHLAALSAKEIAVLSKKLRPLFRKITVLVYLREQSDYIVSMRDTALKTGTRTREMAFPEDVTGLDYRALLQLWQNADLCDVLEARLFDRRDLKDGDVVTDFFDTIRAEDTGFEKSDTQNPSLDLLAHELLPRINAQLPRFDENGRPNPQRGRLPRVLEAFLTRGEKLRASPDLAALCQARFGEGNEWVRQTYFPQRAQLFAERERSAQAGINLPDVYAEELADLIVHLWKIRGR